MRSNEYRTYIAENSLHTLKLHPSFSLYHLLGDEKLRFHACLRSTRYDVIFEVYAYLKSSP